MPSLKARAIAYLARRDYGRDELRERLLRPPHGAKARGRDGAPADDVPPVSAEAVDAVLDSLESAGWLDDQRAATNRAAARAGRHGWRRIEADLARRGLSLDADTAAGLRGTELDRAREVWRRRFGTSPTDARERARQWRFLTGRGFEAATIARVIGGGLDDDPPDPPG
jgi:regulatory protein